MEPDSTSLQSAASLGFVVPPGPGPIPDIQLVLSDADLERQLAESIRQKALVHVDVLSEILVLRATDSTASVKTVVDALDMNYKLSGLAAKNLAKEVAAATVSITINMPPKSEKPAMVIQGAQDVEDAETLPRD